MSSLRSLFTNLAHLRPTRAGEAPRRDAAQARAALPTIDVTDTINRALTAAGLRPASAAAGAVSPTPRRVVPAANARPAPAGRTAASVDGAGGGVSLDRVCTVPAGTRAYTLYVPRGHDPAGHAVLPLVVMLHGCTQDPADFATGTRMNALADRHGVLVAYPAQTPRDNGSRCWNWFRRRDQARDTGEPAILAGIVAEIARSHAVDAQRVYATGLSAGAAMAVILGRTHPDVFAAVGAHSGLPFGAAHDVAGAFSAMQGNAGAPARTRADGMRAVPTIVFHGDADRTVHPRNGSAIADAAIAAVQAIDDAPLVARRTESTVGGRRATRVEYVDQHGRSQVEHWLLEGAGHAWSGGDPGGSYSDAAGPDASAEMLRFFLQHARAAVD